MAYIKWLDGNNSSKRAKVIYECRSLGVRKRKTKTFPPRTPMKDIASFKRQVEQEYQMSEGINYSNLTLRDFTHKYFEMYAEVYLSPTTVRTYKGLAYSEEHGFLKYLGNVRLDKLQKLQVQEFVNMLTESGLSGKTIRNSVFCMRSIINKALQFGYISNSRGNVADNIILPKYRKKQINAYTVEESRVLLKHVNEDGDSIMKLLVTLALGTGMRRSEMS